MRVGNGMIVLVATAVVLVAATAAVSQKAEPTESGRTEATTSADVLLGVWGDVNELFTRMEGELRIRAVGRALEASLAGHTTEVTVDGDAVYFEFPEGRGSYRGSFNGDRTEIRGHWIQGVGRIEIYEFATPTWLLGSADGGWDGLVRPFRERLSLYMRFMTNDDGTVGVIIRNPERNVGWFVRANTVEVKENAVTFFDADGQPRLSGTLNEDRDVLSVVMQGAGTFDLVRQDRDEAVGFYPRLETTPYQYRAPRPDDDGWTVAHAGEVGFDTGRLEAFVQSILDMEIDSHRTPYIQDLTIARNGRLILEEHFFGYHGDEPHDSRSAGKSITSMMVGAAVEEGAFTMDTPVYDLFPESTANPDPRKADLTVEHLITMSSGYDCDDNDYDTPGNEDVMQNQGQQPDWVAYTLDLPMVREPGEADVYCTGGINLLAGIISRTTGEWIPEFFRTRLAEPLEIDRYHVNLDPLGRGYGGGGLRMRPRDFLKLGQTMLDGGRWNGQQVLEESWVDASFTPRASVNVDDDYGYAWWRTVHEHDGTTFESWSATGNGGQLIIVVPAYDLVVTFNGGNYSNFPTWIAWRDELMPRYIVGALTER